MNKIKKVSIVIVIFFLCSFNLANLSAISYPQDAYKQNNSISEGTVIVHSEDNLFCSGNSVEGTVLLLGEDDMEGGNTGDAGPNDMDSDTGDAGLTPVGGGLDCLLMLMFISMQYCILKLRKNIKLTSKMKLLKE